MGNNSPSTEQPITHDFDEQELDNFGDTLNRLTSCDCPACVHYRRWLCHPQRTKMLLRLQNRLRELRQSALKRFSDNPFRPPNLTPEQIERIEERNKALRIFRETGDEGPAIEVGIFPKPKTEN